MSDFFQIEVAGVAITLSDEDAALVVYCDDDKLNYAEVSFEGFNGNSYSAQIIERKESNRSIYAAIFPRIEMPSASSSFNITVSCLNAWQSAVKCTLYKANITEIKLIPRTNFEDRY